MSKPSRKEHPEIKATSLLRPHIYRPVLRLYSTLIFSGIMMPPQKQGQISPDQVVLLSKFL